MRKLLKLFFFILLFIVVIITAGFLYLNVTGLPSYDREEFEFTHTSDSIILERGEKLVATLCAGCHMNTESASLAGTHMLDVPREFGTIYSSNITQDKEVGIGDWSDADLVYLLRTGIKKNGVYSPPYMAKLPKLADEDMNAIIAFLRSDHPLVRSDNTPDKESKPSVLTKFLSRVEFKPFPMPEGPIAMPDQNDHLAVGEYLAINLDCFSCHSADFKTNNYLEPEKSVGFFGGGNAPLDKEGNVILSPNLTPDQETGIGNWSEDQFLQAVKYGQGANGQSLRYPMPKYRLLTDEEVKSIYWYLKTIPPLTNKVERSM